MATDGDTPEIIRWIIEFHDPTRHPTNWSKQYNAYTLDDVTAYANNQCVLHPNWSVVRIYVQPPYEGLVAEGEGDGSGDEPAES